MAPASSSARPLSTPPRPTAGSADPASERLLVAAVDAFAERGYHATTTRDIATRVGMSPAALYVHYPSKAALLGRISRNGHEASLALMEGVLAQTPDDAVLGLRRLVATFTAWHAEQYRTARVVHHELANLAPDDHAEVIALRRRIDALVREVVERGVASGTMHVEHPARVAVAVLSLAVDVARWYDPNGADSPAEIGELYGELALRMVGAV